jgi:Rha family phage regulatory protein
MNYDVTIRNGVQELGIFEKNNDAWVSSRTLKDIFDKRHDNVLQNIENAMKSTPEEFNALNFKLVKYTDKKGEKRPEYLLNRKSFALIAMGFNGKKAMQFKVQYIEYFEAMLSHIETRLLSKSHYKEMTSAIAQNIGNDPKLFAKEADMVNMIVLGMRAKDFRSINNITESEDTRDSVISDKLDKLDQAERLNAQLINSGLDFETRKQILTTNFKDS